MSLLEYKTWKKIHSMPRMYCSSCVKYLRTVNVDFMYTLFFDTKSEAFISMVVLVFLRSSGVCSNNQALCTFSVR